eukprot:1903376-Prymnesium_polylepis.1
MWRSQPDSSGSVIAVRFAFSSWIMDALTFCTTARACRSAAHSPRDQRMVAFTTCTSPCSTVSVERELNRVCTSSGASLSVAT